MFCGARKIGRSSSEKVQEQKDLHICKYHRFVVCMNIISGKLKEWGKRP